MDPSPVSPRRLWRWLPRTRGDGPACRPMSDRRLAAPPHSRGWTRAKKTDQTMLWGSPALAGMDPGPPPWLEAERWLPRTRGDRPNMLWLGLGVGVQQLQRKPLVRSGVLHLPDRTHSAFPDLADKTVLPVDDAANVHATTPDKNQTEAITHAAGLEGAILDPKLDASALLLARRQLPSRPRRRSRVPPEPEEQAPSRD